MPIYRKDSSGRFVGFERTPFADLERTLEDWIEADPHVLLDGEDIAILARQPRTAFAKFVDLLGVDASGACVVIELKRGVTPRDVLAQALEYAAWVDSLSLDDLDRLAREYALRRGLSEQGLIDIYRRTFADADDEEDEEDGEPVDDDIADRITFNHRQRLVIVAERISDEVEQTLRYMRTSLGIDITGVQFGIHQAGGEILLETDMRVGRELPTRAASRVVAARPGVLTGTHDEMVASGARTTEFVRRAVTAIDEWVGSLAIPGLEYRRRRRAGPVIRYQGRPMIGLRFRQRWVNCVLVSPTDAEIEMLRQRLAEPGEINTQRKGGHTRFHMVNDGDLDVLKDIVLTRVGGAPSLDRN